MLHLTGRTSFRSGQKHSLVARLLGSSALVILFPLTLHAQQVDRATTLDVINVEGSSVSTDRTSIVARRASSGSKIEQDLIRAPATISVITAREMEQRGASSVEKALQYTPGVSTDYYGSDDRFEAYKIRGLDAYIYRDGLRVGNPFGAIPEESYAYERIEILKGANSTSFGVSDPGGAVNLVTKRPDGTRFGEAYIEGGSFNRKEVGFDFGDKLTEDATLSYRLTGRLQDGKAEYEYSRDDQKFLMGGITWSPTDATRFSVILDHIKRDGVPGGSGQPIGLDIRVDRFFGEPDFNYRGTDRNTISTIFEHEFDSGLSFSANTRYSRTKSDFGYVYVDGILDPSEFTVNRSAFANDSWRNEFATDARLQYDAQLGSIESKSLVGTAYNDLSSNTDGYWSDSAVGPISWVNPIFTGPPVFVPRYNSNGTDQTVKAIYAQQDVTLFDKLLVSVSLRNDWIKGKSLNRIRNVTTNGNHSELTKRIGASYQLTEQFAAYANYAESAVPAGSQNQEPEKGKQIELGVKYQPDSFPGILTAAVYDLTKYNITRTDPITFQPATIGEVRVKGIELEAKAELPNGFSLISGAAYLDTEVVSNGTRGNEGNRLSYISNFMASTWLNYDIEGEGKRGDISLGFGGRYTGSYYSDDENTIKIKPNMVFDASIRYDIVENTSLSFNVQNVFNRNHIAYVSTADWRSPGRVFGVTLKQTW